MLTKLHLRAALKLHRPELCRHRLHWRPLGVGLTSVQPAKRGALHLLAAQSCRDPSVHQGDLGIPAIDLAAAHVLAGDVGSPSQLAVPLPLGRPACAIHGALQHAPPVGARPCSHVDRRHRLGCDRLVRFAHQLHEPARRLAHLVLERRAAPLVRLAAGVQCGGRHDLPALPAHVDPRRHLASAVADLPLADPQEVEVQPAAASLGQHGLRQGAVLSLQAREAVSSTLAVDVKDPQARGGGDAHPATRLLGPPLAELLRVARRPLLPAFDPGVLGPWSLWHHSPPQPRVQFSKFQHSAHLSTAAQRRSLSKPGRSRRAVRLQPQPPRPGADGEA